MQHDIDFKIIHNTSDTNGTSERPITVLNSENLQSPDGKLKEIRGYVTRTSEPGKNTVHLEGVPAGGDCE